LNSPLRVLHLEDNPLDVALVKTTLERADIACTTTTVDNRASFVAALEGGKFDLIISDFKLPEFDGWSALEIARARWPTLPFILVSGTLGEEQAIDSLKRGATD
jgi:CheY-like chemotaxis protein